MDISNITNNQNAIIIIVIIVVIICCSSISIIGTIYYNNASRPIIPVYPTISPPLYTPILPPISPPISPPILPPISPPILPPAPVMSPKIRFCSEANLGGTCKTYDLQYKLYPIESECGPDAIGFRPRSISIDNDNSANYKLFLRGYYGNAGDNDCGPSQVELDGSPNCYTNDIYGISGDRGTCLSDTASGVNWILNNPRGGVRGGINVTR